jgi:hypothetical protein
MKNREHILQMKEKLIYCFWKRIVEENREVVSEKKNDESSESIDAGNSIDSTMASHHNNTPKNKQLGKVEEKEKTNVDIVAPQNVLYKYFIGKGNNSIMVRSLFKNRYWWVTADQGENDKCNFWWTQVKS